MLFHREIRLARFALAYKNDKCEVCQNGLYYILHKKAVLYKKKIHKQVHTNGIM